MSRLFIRSLLVDYIKRLFGISNLSLFIRRRVHGLEKLIYHRKYSADDIIRAIEDSGVKPGTPILVHSSFSNFYNYTGTIDELIDKLIAFAGPNGTVCMPAFPSNKFDPSQVFDVSRTKSAAGVLTEFFRLRPNVYRSMNQLHSVCAIGKDAEYITKDHQFSRISYDEHSPFYKIAELGGYSISLGMPKWYIGTGCHICEALLYGKLPYFTEKFSIEKEYTYIDTQGITFKHKMFVKSKRNYIRYKNTKLIDSYFDKSKFGRLRLSNIWVSTFELKYLYERLMELAREGKTLYRTPIFFN